MLLLGMTHQSQLERRINKSLNLTDSLKIVAIGIDVLDTEVDLKLVMK
jgi:hypothetical protein